MSLAIVHFAVGFGSTVLLWTFLKQDDTDYILPVLLAGAFWAMIPDLHNIMPVFQEAYRTTIHSSFFANIFWFHRVIDIADPQDTVDVAAISLVYLTVCVCLREVYLYRLDTEK